MKKAISSISIFLIMILMIGCNQIAEKSNPPNTISTNIKKVEIVEENYQKVFGDVKVETLRAQLSDGRPWLELAISDKGEIFGFTPQTKDSPMEIISYNLNTKTLQSIYSSNNDVSPIYFKFNDNYLAWTEVTNNSSQGISRIVVYDRKTQKVTVVNENKEFSTNESYEMIALNSDYLLWSTSKTDKGKVINEIMKYDLKTQEISLLRENAIMPIVGKDFIAWLGPEDDQMKYSAIYLNDLKDNSIKKIVTDGQHPTYINTDGISIVITGFSSENPNLKVLSVYQNGEIRIIKESKTDYFEFPEISQNFVGWRGTLKLSVYSRKDDKIGILTEEYAAYTEVKVSDKYILWHSPAIKDENEARQKAMEQNIYLSDLHVISKDDFVQLQE